MNAIAVQGEHFEQLVRTMADNLMAMFERNQRELREYQADTREQSRQLARMIGDHEQRIGRLKRKRRPRGPTNG